MYYTSSKTELLTLAITKSLVSLLFINASHFQIMNNVVRLNNSMGINSCIQSLCYKISFFVTRNDLCYTIMMDKAFCKSIMVIMVETWTRKANSYPEYVNIPLSMILCSFHMENTQSSRCHLVSGWSLQRTVSNQDFNADIYYCQALSSSVI